MNRSQIRVSAVLLALVLPTLARADHPAQAAADRAVALLVDGDFQAVSALHQYPPAYSSGELLDDKRAVSKGLSLLVGRFGSPSVVGPSETFRYFYHVGSGGGTVAYWATIPTSSVTTHVYEVGFEFAGEGFIKVDVVSIENGAAPRIKAIEFGLPAERPEAKQLVVLTMKELLIESGVRLPENFDELFERAMRPTGSVPASNQ